MFRCDGMVVVVYCFFFFKQMTAYEVRISDWSSDVCSSDLFDRLWRAPDRGDELRQSQESAATRRCRGTGRDAARARGRHLYRPRPQPLRRRARARDRTHRRTRRSEEHTSELQSLMRISYAVFCLTKKIRNTEKYTHHHTAPPLSNLTVQ